jgi:hypothetical protein
VRLIATAAVAALCGLPLQAAEPPARKQASAVRVPAGSIQVDGRLEEAAWATVAALEDFTQKEPSQGAAPTDRRQVRIAYDEDALYVGARLYARDPKAIQAPLSRRDVGHQSEHLLISLDTYLDRRTAYTFGVTASGVRLDYYHRADNELDIDGSFDPVWQAKAVIDGEGWTAEMRIPFTQLRFNDRAQQVWGLNIDHWIPSRNEDVYWVVIPKDVTAWASRFGELRGIEGVRPRRRLELLPYGSAGGRFSGRPAAGDPFRDGSETEGRVGGDLKMGLGPGLTLQAAVNPDFGQVEADPAEVNLSAFETFFDEKRPFFTENQQLFEGGLGYFYSRRIGQRPRGPAEGEFVDFPATSTILGAAKLTGRLPSGLSLGALGAITGQESARTFDTGMGAPASLRVAPRTAYGVVRAQQEVGAAASTVGFMLTGVHRSLEAADPLADLHVRNAFSGGVDSLLRFAGGTYQLITTAGFSHVAGEPAAIDRLQRSSARYYQRPDATHVTYDPTRRALSGWHAYVELEKENGRHWLWEVSAGAESPGLELNDAGRIGTADGLTFFGQLVYRETRPGRVLHNYSVSFNTENEWNFARERQFGALRSDATLTWKNFWVTNLTAWVDLRAQDERLTRGGPSMGLPRAWVTIAQLSSASFARTKWNGRVYYGRNELGGLTYRLSGGVSLRPGPRWQLSIDPNYLRAVDPRQYVDTLPGGRAVTFGQRYVFASLDQSTLLAQVRLNYTLRPDLTLELYAEPFTASGRYLDFGELLAPRSRMLRAYGAEGTTLTRHADGSRTVRDGEAAFTLEDRDFRVRSFRSNLVLRWEWRPGSTLYVIWQQDRFGSEVRGDRIGPRDLFRSFTAPGDNVLAVKASFWVPLG